MPRFEYRPDSPLQYPGVALIREAQECEPPIVETHALRLEVLRADLIHPRSPATAELFNHLSDFSLRDERVQPRVPSLYFHLGMRDGRIEEILEVLLPPPDNVPSRGQPLPTHTVNSVGEALLPPTEALDGLPESLRGTLGLTVPVSRLRSATSQPQPIGPLLLLDSIPSCWCPPPGSGIAATTGTADLTAKAAGSSIDNRCGDHGPLGLYVSNIPPELCQTSPADPHYALQLTTRW
ncbi:hypothetical protein GOODEAATRI_020582 [Goodea atripinnis]|uniref:Uncharacterized protein n=1 Tax=Goodea atripinnis TaxID=208336 RepID=A0ABV0P6H9_9TELE